MFITVLSVFSCIKVVPYPDTNEDKMLKINAFVGNRDSSFFYLDRVYPLIGGSMIHPDKIDSLYADIHLTVNGNPIETEKMFDMDTLRATYYTLYRFSPGDKVGFNAYVRGFPEISSETVIPDSPENDVESIKVIIEGNGNRTLEVIIDDPENSKDYYAVYMEARTDRKYEADPMQVALTVRFDGSLDSSLNYDSMWILVDDVLADASSRMRFTANLTGVLEARVKVRRISKGYYFGLINSIGKSFGFSNTGSISYSNIKGGMGCLGAYNEYVSEWIQLR